MPDAVGTRLAARERERVEELVRMGYYLNEADFLRDAVRNRLQDFEVVFVQQPGIGAVKKKVLQLVRAEPNLYADEIAARLNLDIEPVIRAIDALVREKKVTA